MREWSQNKLPENCENNGIWIGDRFFEASADRILVVQDEFRSGFECSQCGDKEHMIISGYYDGKQVSVVDCDNCQGRGHYMKGENEIRCAICEGRGKVPCPRCGGKGGATIVLADVNKGRTTTGLIVSVGKNVEGYALGERVVYQAFAGHGFSIAGVDRQGKTERFFLVYHIDRDILGYVRNGQLEMKMVESSMALHTLA